MSDPQVAEARKKLLEKGAQTTNGDVMATVYPLLMDKHRGAVCGMIAAMSGKTADEVRAQPLGETMTVIRAGFTGELFRFFAVCRAFGAQIVADLAARLREKA